MLRQLKYAVPIFVLLQTQPAHAVENPLVSLKGVSSEQCMTGIKGEICHHAFENSKMTIALDMPDASKDKECPAISARLLQISTRLEAPLYDAIKPDNINACARQSFEAQLPGVREETEFAIELSYEGTGKKAPPFRTLSLKVYPSDLLAPLKSWTENKSNILLVRDKEGKLADFLDKNKIEYVTRAAEQRDITTAYIIVGNNDDGAEKPAGNAIYLEERVVNLPKVTIDHTSKTTIATVQLKLLDRLTDKDPLAEKLLMEIFKLTTK